MGSLVSRVSGSSSSAEEASSSLVKQRSRKRSRSASVSLAATEPPEPVVIEIGEDDNVRVIPYKKPRIEPVLVEMGKQSSSSCPRLPGNDDDDDDDSFCCIVGTTGSTALVDFAHSRHDCAVYPMMTQQPHKYCPNCYCFVCDVPVKECTDWKLHSHAQDTPSWQRLRATKKVLKSTTSSTMASTMAGSGDGGVLLKQRVAATTSTTLSHSSSSSFRYTKSQRKLLRALDLHNRQQQHQRDDPNGRRTQRHLCDRSWCAKPVLGTHKVPCTQCSRLPMLKQLYFVQTTTGSTTNACGGKQKLCQGCMQRTLLCLRSNVDDVNNNKN